MLSEFHAYTRISQWRQVHSTSERPNRRRLLRATCTGRGLVLNFRVQVYSRPREHLALGFFYPCFASRRAVAAQLAFLAVAAAFNRAAYVSRIIRRSGTPPVSVHPETIWWRLLSLPTTIDPSAQRCSRFSLMLQHIPFPILPAPPSWFPGHMNQFRRQLPVLLKHTDVVLELRDARLPLTSINRTFEGWLASVLTSSLQSGHDGHDIVAARQVLSCGEGVLWCSFYSAAVQFFTSYWSSMVRANRRRRYLNTLISRMTPIWPSITTIVDDPILYLYSHSLLASTELLSP